MYLLEQMHLMTTWESWDVPEGAKRCIKANVWSVGTAGVLVSVSNLNVLFWGPLT